MWQKQYMWVEKENRLWKRSLSLSIFGYKGRVDKILATDSFYSSPSAEVQKQAEKIIPLSLALRYELIF